MSAKEPDHITPGGVALSRNNDVGADRGSVGVGGEQEGAVGGVQVKVAERVQQGMWVEHG